MGKANATITTSGESPGERRQCCHRHHHTTNHQQQSHLLRVAGYVIRRRRGFLRIAEGAQLRPTSPRVNKQT
jgi:hypothetical protein